MGAQPGERLGDGARSRFADEAGSPVLDDLERAARVARRHDRLLGQERLEGDEAHVFVDRRIEDREALRVLVGEGVVVQPARERDPPVEPVAARELLEPWAIGAFARDHDAQVAVGGRGLEQEVDPLRAVEPSRRRGRSRRTRRSGTRAAEAAAAAPRPRARPTCSSLDATFSEIANSRCASERRPVQPVHCASRGAVERLLPVLAELGAVEVVGLAELVDEPHHLVGMANDVGGELRPDHEVDRAALHLLEVEQAPDE